MNPTFLKRFGVILLVLSAIFGSYYLGVRTGQSRMGEVVKVPGVSAQEPPVSANANVDFSPFWKAWSIINSNFVPGGNGTSTTFNDTQKTTDQDKVWGAISGLVDSLGDPYSVFFPPKEKEAFDEAIAGNFSGVGMELGLKDGIPTVISPLPDSPAKKGGILAGDKILKVDDASVGSMSLDEVISHIRGKEGTTVSLTILHSEKNSVPVVIKLVRAIIQIPTIDTAEKNGVFIISLYNFSENSADLFRQALLKFYQSGTNRLVIDLRGNPGGYLESAVEMSSYFLPKGKVIVTERSKNKADSVHTSLGLNGAFTPKFGLKMVVLVDRGSASAAEILAGALSEHKVATLVGEKTFGKGSVQTLIPVTRDSAIKLTIAKWLTPNGLSISGNGLTPEIAVLNSTSTVVKAGDDNDLQLKKALEVVKKIHPI